MIYLLKNKNHFDVITSMTGFLCKSYYCHTCKKTYKRRNCHKCPAKCIACFKYFKDGKKCSGEIIECQDCNRSFFGEECFNEHKRNRGKKNYSNIGKDLEPNCDNKELYYLEFDSVCNRVKKCPKCESVFTDRKLCGDKNEVHICGYSVCGNCKKYCNMNRHHCFMMKKMCKGGNCDGTCNEEEKKTCYPCKTFNQDYIFYDFETNQESGVHIVNWVDCEDFYGIKNTFETIDEFCQFIFQDEHIFLHSLLTMQKVTMLSLSEIGVLKKV